MPFTNYNGIQQADANSCGAYALGAAMDNFAIALPDQTTHLLNTANLTAGFNGTAAVVSHAGGAAAFANGIYAVTGNLLLNFATFAATYQYTAPAVSDMNSPSTMAYLSSLFGFATTVFYDQDGSNTFNGITVSNATGQGNLFDTEVAIMGTVPAITITASLAGYSTLPTANQVHILLVDNNHWIAINNTQVYDSATGFVGAYNAPLVPTLTLITYQPAIGPLQVYNFSGIWIQVQH